MTTSEPISLEQIRMARSRIDDVVLRSPLMKLNGIETRSEIYLKPENLQPIGSFKIRGALNAMRAADPETLAQGVYTASAGNMAQGVAYAAMQLGISCRVIVPEQAPRAKTEPVERMGGTIVRVPFDEWWETMETHGRADMPGFFIHPFADEAVMAGNGTIGLEIHEDMPEVDTVIVPYGGGGLSVGIASAIKAIKPDVKVFACEVSTAAPLAMSLKAGVPQVIEHTKSFVDGIGGKSVFPEMWPRVQALMDGSIVVSPEQIADAMRRLMRCQRLVTEGAGAASLAAALAQRADLGERIVCVLSGGNIDLSVLASILSGTMP
jgi:threonine dehydratase